MSKTVTIEDVAQEANVSISTASYALNNGPRPVSQETRAKVLAIARRLNFSPNAIARGLVSRGMRTIGVAFYSIEYVADPAISTILSGVSYVTGLKDYNLQFATTNRTSRAHKNQYFITKVEEKRLDGVIIFDQRVADAEILRLREIGTPLVVIDRDVPGLRSPMILVDYKKSMDISVKHFLEHGFERIGFHSGTDYLYADALRIKTLKEILAKVGVKCDERLIFQSQTKGTFPKASEVLRSVGKGPVALVVAADQDALEILRVARSLGMTPGKDIGVVCFDDRPIATSVQPQLTVLRLPYQKIGKVAANLLINMIEHGEQQARRILVPPRLVVRESCGSHESGTGEGYL